MPRPRVSPFRHGRPASLAWVVLRVLGTVFLLGDGADTLFFSHGLASKALQTAINVSVILLLWWPFPGAVAALLTLVGCLVIPPEGQDLYLLLIPPIVLIPRLGRRGMVLLGGTLTLFAAAIPVRQGVDQLYVATVLRLLLLLLGCLIGVAVRGFQSQHEAGQRRIEELEAENRQIRADERTSLARELHDVVAHQLSIISLQIMGHRDAEDPEELRDALDRVDEAARSALGELQVLLQVLRDDSPTPERLSRLAEVTAPGPMLQQAARALTDNGFVVETDVARGVDDLERSRQLTLARIIQEATTNVLRHAPEGSRVRLEVSLDDEWIHVLVLSQLSREGSRLPQLSMGYGLRGLRERVSLVGGTIEVGPRGDRWAVEARLPRSVSRRQGQAAGGGTASSEGAEGPAA